jgi:hypothetical protein
VAQAVVELADRRYVGYGGSLFGKSAPPFRQIIGASSHS